MRNLFLNDHGWRPQPTFNQRFWAAHFCGRLADVGEHEGDMMYRHPAWVIEAAFDSDEKRFFPGGTYNGCKPTDS